MPPLRISDHALVRFLERAGGVDVEALRDQIATGLRRAGEAGAKLGVSDCMITVDGLTFVVRDGAVATVLNDLHPKARVRALAPRGGQG